MANRQSFEESTETLNNSIVSDEIIQKEEQIEDERILTQSAGQNIKGYDTQIANQHKLRILLAEDSLVNMKIALLFLRKLGYHADVAFNGIEVIDALKRRAYDVILMDAEMPEMDGKQATMVIRKTFAENQQPHIIAMTAHTQEGERGELLSIGMNDYITKPLKMEDLVKALMASKQLADITDFEANGFDNEIRKVA